MPDINWGLLTSASPPQVNPIDALHQGTVDRDALLQTALKQRQFQAAQVVAHQQAQAQQQAGAAYAAGDTRGANAALIGSGQNELLGTVNTTTKQDFDQNQAGQKAIADMAGYIQEHVPAENRPAFIQHLSPWLQAAGAHPSDIATVASDPTNETLGAIARSFYSPQDQAAAQVAQQNANSTTQNAGINQQNADTTRMGEIRQEQTPVGFAGTDNVYVPGGVGAGSGSTATTPVGSITSPATGLAAVPTHGGWTPRFRNGGNNTDAAVDGKIAGASHFLGLDPNANLSGVSPLRIAQAMTLSEGGAGTLADRNNNPANIADGPFARSQAGYIGQGDGGYAKFADKNAGLNAAANLVAHKLATGQTTVRTMIEGLPTNGAAPQGQAIGQPMGQPMSGVRGPTLITAAVPKENPNAVDPTDPAIEMAARQYAATGDMPALGNGQGPMRHAILTRAAQIVQQNHWTPAQIAANKATVRSSTTALAADQKMYDTIQTSEETALANGQRYLDLAGQMPGNTSSTWYNRIRNGIGAEFSDRRVTDANTAYQTFISEYNRVINSTPTGSGTLTDATRREAQDTFNNATSQEARVSAFNVMKADMAARKASQQHIIDRRTSIIANIGQTPASGDPVHVSSAADYHALPSNTLYIDPTGHQRRKP